MAKKCRKYGHQWNRIKCPISEVSSFQGSNSILWERNGVLIKELSSFQGCPNRASTVIHLSLETVWDLIM